MRTAIKYLGLYMLGLLALEHLGRLYISLQEKEQLTGVLAEDLMSLREPFIQFGLKKNYNKDLGYWKAQTNAQGLREETDLPPKTTGEHRVFLVGGSTVFGWGVNATETIPYYLQKKILQENPKSKVRVYNAGVPWYSSPYEFHWVVNRLLALHPDSIWVLNGLNDAAQAVSPDWQPVASGKVDMASSLCYEEEKLNPFLRFIFSHSQVLSFIRAKSKTRTELKTGVLHPEAWDQYLSYYENLQVILKRKNIQLKVYFQPVMFVDKPTTRYERDHNGTSMRESLFRDTFVHQYQVGEEKISAQASFAFKSLKSLFSKDPVDIYLDGLHYNATGNKKIGDAILRLESSDTDSIFL